MPDQHIRDLQRGSFNMNMRLSGFDTKPSGFITSFNPAKIHIFKFLFPCALYAILFSSCSLCPPPPAIAVSKDPEPEPRAQPFL